jgi:NDP-sugar pyrophosphorylase family protein
LTLDGDRVTAYEEKPAIAVTVCSAIAALGPPALEAIDGPMGLVDLTNALLHNGSRVTAYRHDAPWVDVNDVLDVARAEALVREHASEFA